MRTAVRTGGACVLAGVTVVLVVTDLVIRGRHPTRFPSNSGVGVPVTSALALATLGFTVVGLLLVARARPHRYGWALSGLALGLAALSSGFAVGQVDALPRWLALPLASSAVPVVFLTASAVFALFPSGRLPDPAWRWLGRVTVGASTLLASVGLLLGPDRNIPGLLGEGEALKRAGDVIASGLLVLLTGCLLGAVLALVARHRRAGPAERQQLRWFTAAGGVFAGVFLVGSLAGVLASDGDPGPITGVATGISLLLVPVAIAVAVLRYRLYQIDRLISRTVSYALLTAVLAGVYLTAVAVVGRLLHPLTDGSQLAVATSTLAVAALFRPVRRRVQTAVDRRFDRARYDAERTVDAYARRLRTEVDLDEVTTGLRDTVTATVGPQRVGLWLRPRAD